MHAAAKTDSMLKLWASVRSRRMVQTERQRMDRRVAEADARALADAPALVADPLRSAGSERAGGDR